MIRNKAMVLRFTQAEMDALTKKAKKSGRNREAFCRAVLNGATLREAPPVEYAELLCEIKRMSGEVGRILNQVDTGGQVSPDEIQELKKGLFGAEMLLWETFMPVRK